MKNNHKYTLFLILPLIVFGGCKKIFDLPEEKDFLSENLNYGNKVLEPILGRTTVMGELNADKSTYPLQFEITNARFGDGRKITDMLQVHKTWAWIAPYTGKETSLNEINAKRRLEDRPIFEVRSSGQFILWESSTNELVTPRPADSSDLVQDIRYFDLKVKNSGGELVIKDFKIRPWRERPYEPSNDINPYTGATARDPNDPNNPNKRDYITPSVLNNVIGTESNTRLENNNTRKDVVVYIRPFSGGNGNSLRFVFLDKDNNTIDPVKFNETKWDYIVHGFNKQMTTAYVQYDVAYPIPLVKIRTSYAPNGSEATSIFSYSRKGFGGERTTAEVGLNYNIYRKGDWEIVFHFRRENPKFEDE
jgi:hypothetical protein